MAYVTRLLPYGVGPLGQSAKHPHKTGLAHRKNEVLQVSDINAVRIVLDGKTIARPHPKSISGKQLARKIKVRLGLNKAG